MTPTYRASWPITDLDRTQASLIQEAEQDVPNMLHHNNIQLTGPLTWRVTEAWKAGCTPDRANPDDLVLELTAPAQPWEDPRPQRAKR